MSLIVVANDDMASYREPEVVGMSVESVYSLHVITEHPAVYGTVGEGNGIISSTEVLVCFTSADTVTTVGTPDCL